MGRTHHRVHPGSQGATRSHAPADRGVLRALSPAGRGRPGRDPGHQPDRPGQSAPAGRAARRGHHRWRVREAEPVRRADDHPADRDRADRRRPELPQQRHRPERHAGPARRALRAPAADAAAILHRDADRRDPEPTGERRRRRPGGRHRHGELHHQQPGDRHQHDRGDVHPELAAGRAVARPAAVLPVPDLPGRQGPAGDLDRDAEVHGRDERDHRGDPQRVGHAPLEDLRPAGQRDQEVPGDQQGPGGPPDPPGDGRAAGSS